MATDIVERLLVSATAYHSPTKELAVEAADEIERLRGALDTCRELRKFDAAEIERLRELLRSEGANRYWEGRWRDADVEIGRFRAALKSLTKDPPAFLAREPDTDAEVIIKMRDIARAALDHGLPTAADVRGILKQPDERKA